MTTDEEGGGEPRRAPPAPDFAIVGAAKCGTTALYTYLAGHPGIAMSRRKEPCFWSPDVERFGRVESSSEYEALWEGAPPGALRGEASTAYIQSNVAVPEILRLRPDAKFIAMLRNPVEMAPARHSEMLNRFHEDVGDFERAWRLQEARRRGEHIPAACGERQTLQYHEVSAIGDFLARFLERVPEGQRLVILFDDLKADARRVYLETLRFLGLEDDGRSDFRPVHTNRNLRSTRFARIHRALPRTLGPIYRPARVLASRLDISPSALVNRINVHHAPRPPLRPAFEAELIAAFTPQIEKVEALLGRDLSHWRKPRSGR